MIKLPWFFRTTDKRAGWWGFSPDRREPECKINVQVGSTQDNKRAMCVVGNR